MVKQAEVGIIGAGLAGLSAAIYLGRAKRRTFVIDSGHSMARWEPKVENYLGFPQRVHGKSLLEKGTRQARRYGTKIYRDRINAAETTEQGFLLHGNRHKYRCDFLLLATGIFHIPPDLPGVKPCLGKSMFFCKDCDGYRVHGKPIAIYGWNDEAVEYALAMLLYSPCVVIVTDGRKPQWGSQHQEWVDDYHVPIYTQQITSVQRRGSQLQGLCFADTTEVLVRVLFTTRGDVYYNELARQLGVQVKPAGEIIVDMDGRTSVQGVYAAGCITPANCQMIIAAGQGATAAQAINRALFEQSLAQHSLRRYRHKQLRNHRVHPRLRATSANPSILPVKPG